MRKGIYWVGAALAVIAFFAGFFVGRSTENPAEGTTFYAEIEAVDEDNLTVHGLGVNDMNSRGRFCFTVTNETVLEWRHTDITLDDLKAGDTVAVTYLGVVDETSPARLHDVVKVQLLEDER